VPDFPVDFESWCVIDIREFPKLERLVIMNETREICEGASRVAGRDEVENLVDQFREMYDGEMLTMPKIELWERDEEGNGSMKYKEDITPRF
jgi:antirestriction protein